MRCILILCLCLAVQAFSAQNIRNLIIVAGQSNAVGFDADASKLAVDASDKDVLFWWRCGDPAPDQYDSTSEDQWTFLQSQPRGIPLQDKNIPRQYGNFRFPGGGFGPEIGLARRLMEKQNQPLAIVKVAYSGTGLGTDWNPVDPGAGGACYRALVDEVKKAVFAAEKNGLALKLHALVWVQGESDSGPEKAAQYGRRLEEMIKALRQDLSAPELIVLTGLNTEFGKSGGAKKVAQAQRDLAGRMDCCVYVDTDGASLANRAHFDAAGELEIGRRFADVLMEYEDKRF